MKAVWAWLVEALTTARCLGCPNRVRIVGPWYANRRESAYCEACLSFDRSIN